MSRFVRFKNWLLMAMSFIFKTAKHRIAHKPHSKPKTSDIFEAEFANDLKSKDLLADKELWDRLEELERQEELLGEIDIDRYLMTNFLTHISL